MKRLPNPSRVRWLATAVASSVLVLVVTGPAACGETDPLPPAAAAAPAPGPAPVAAPADEAHDLAWARKRAAELGGGVRPEDVLGPHAVRARPLQPGQDGGTAGAGRARDRAHRSAPREPELRAREHGHRHLHPAGAARRPAALQLGDVEERPLAGLGHAGRGHRGAQGRARRERRQLRLRQGHGRRGRVGRQLGQSLEPDRRAAHPQEGRRVGPAQHGLHLRPAQGRQVA